MQTDGEAFREFERPNATGKSSSVRKFEEGLLQLSRAKSSFYKADGLGLTLSVHIDFGSSRGMNCKTELPALLSLPDSQSVRGAASTA